MVENIFRLDNADRLTCRIKWYGIGHSVLTIHVDGADAEFPTVLQFTHVEYFGGPVSWKGANFQLVTEAELGKLEADLPVPTPGARIIILKPVGMEGVTIAVIAKTAFRLDEEGQDSHSTFNPLAAD